MGRPMIPTNVPSAPLYAIPLPDPPRLRYSAPLTMLLLLASGILEAQRDPRSFSFQPLSLREFGVGRLSTTNPFRGPLPPDRFPPPNPEGTGGLRTLSSTVSQDSAMGFFVRRLFPLIRADEVMIGVNPS